MVPDDKTHPHLQWVMEGSVCRRRRQRPSAAYIRQRARHLGKQEQQILCINRSICKWRSKLSYSAAFAALQKLKELYDSHFALEVVQLMIKLFTLELKNNDPLALASEIKSIRRIFLGFPLKLERFWPWMITYILCLLSLYCLCFGSFLMKKNTIII